MQLSGYFKLDIDKSPAMHWQSYELSPEGAPVSPVAAIQESPPPFTADPKDISIMEDQAGIAHVVRSWISTAAN